MTRALAALLALVASACSFTADWGETTFRCNADRDCPSGFACGDDDLCHPSDKGGDGGAGDGGPDVDGGPTRSGCGAVGVLGSSFDDDLWHEAWGDITWSAGETELEASLLTGAAAEGAFETIREYYLSDGDALSMSMVGLGDSLDISARLIVEKAGPNIEVGVTDGSLVVQEFSDGNAVNRYSAPYDADAHRHWQLARVGDDLVASASPDGAAWDELTTRPITDPIERIVVRVAIYVSVEEDLAENTSLSFGELETTPSPRCAVEALVDDFDDPAIEPVWELYDTSGGDCAADEDVGVLRLTAMASTGECGYRSRLGFDLNDSALTVEVPGPGDDDDDPLLEVAMMGLDDGVYRFLLAGTPRELAVSTPDTADVSVPFDQGGHRFWRMRHSGSTLHFETSPDGDAWDELTAAGVTLPRDMVVYLNAQGGTGVVEYDRVNVAPSE